jgi:hypothetical protein
MARKKALTPAQYRKATERHLKGQPKLLKGKAAAKTAKARAQHYSRGDKLVKQVSDTLQKIAASHPSPAAKKQAKLALKKLGEAQNCFGTASMCQGGSDPTWNN